MFPRLFQVNVQIENEHIALKAETNIPAHLSVIYDRLECRQILKKKKSWGEGRYAFMAWDFDVKQSTYGLGGTEQSTRQLGMIWILKSTWLQKEPWTWVEADIWGSVEAVAMDDN